MSAEQVAPRPRADESQEHHPRHDSITCGATKPSPIGPLVCDRPVLHPGPHTQGGATGMATPMNRSSCPHTMVADTSREPAIDITLAQRLTCQTCGTVVVNVNGEHNPDLDLAAQIPTDPALDTGCEGCE